MDMECQEVRGQLSELVDGELSPDRQEAIRRHLASCAACAGLARDLDRLRTAARQLGPIDPPSHLWLEIAGQMRLEQPAPAAPSAAQAASARRHPMWQWVGLAAALVLITLTVYVARHVPAPGAQPAAPGPAPAVAATGNAAPAGSVETFQDELKQAEAHYEKAIAELEAIRTNNDGSMDPAIAAEVTKNLATIDRAIADSRAALTTNPESEPARDSLFDALRRKVGVLQATVALMNEMRKGNQEGAARAAAGLGRKS